MKYGEYKNSGISWVGEIPVNWRKKRIKFLCSNSSAGIWGEEEQGDLNDIACFRIADFDYQTGYLRFDKLTTRNIQSKDLCGRVLDVNSLLIEKSGGGDATPVGRVVRYNFDDKATCSNFIHFITIDELYNRDFLYYYFYALYANKENLLYFNQTTGIQNLKVGEYLGQSIFLPEHPEQQAIAIYLDEKCGEINRAIDVQNKKIELLSELKQTIITDAVTKGLNSNVPMKDSGVEWIGVIPEHWKIRRTRFLCKIQTGDKDTVNRIDDGRYPFYVRSPKVERIDSYTFDGEAVLMAGDGVGAGKVFHYANGKFDYHQRVYNLHNFKDVGGLYYYYYISNKFKYIIEEGVAKNTVDSVRLNMIQDFWVTIPPLSEQQNIVAHIEKECAKIDLQMSKANRRIELLNELKQSIITEAVTGKIKVC